jgi:AcrR family transcriptional regulator
MRYKDDNKNENIFNSAIELINEIGFAETSMSKIAKKAKISPSTIYVYFENKEDMINKLYVTVKQKMSQMILRDINESNPIKAGLEVILKNYITFAVEYKEYFLFIEQFENSPLIQKISRKEGVNQFKPMYDLFERGKKEKLLKQVPTNLLVISSYAPIMQLAKDYFNGEAEFSDEAIKAIIDMNWDSISK